MLIVFSEIWRELVQHHSWGPAREDTRGAGSSPYSAQVLIHHKLSKNHLSICYENIYAITWFYNIFSVLDIKANKNYQPYTALWPQTPVLWGPDVLFRIRIPDSGLSDHSGFGSGPGADLQVRPRKIVSISHQQNFPEVVCNNDKSDYFK